MIIEVLAIIGGFSIHYLISMMVFHFCVRFIDAKDSIDGRIACLFLWPLALTVAIIVIIIGRVRRIKELEKKVNDLEKKIRNIKTKRTGGKK